jgi:hypothetical protein
MLPRDLTEAMFHSYPPLGQKRALENLPLLRDLPLVLDAILLRELQGYDASFPRERADIDARLHYLASLSAESRHVLTQSFAGISLSAALVAEDWVHSPHKFEEDLSAHLWASHQLDSFHATSGEFVQKVEDAIPAAAPALPRLVIAVLPPALSKEGYPLFRKLLPGGTLFTHVDAGPDTDGMDAVLERLAQRASHAPQPYAHWYIDGGDPIPSSSNAVCRFSWTSTDFIRSAVLRKVESVIGSGSAGPEMLRSMMADWKPPQPTSASSDPLINAFVQRVYGEGSGTQIFSTTFVQWSSRELLKRAQPLTLVARFGPRQRQREMNEMFSSTALQMDPEGSAVDADFAAYYTWINLQRLQGSETASFLAWSQHDQCAIAIGPGFPRGTESAASIPITKLLNLIAGA